MNKPHIKKQGNMFLCRTVDKMTPYAYGYGRLPATAYRNYDLRCHGFNGESDPYLVAIHVDRMKYCNAGTMVFKRARIRIETQLRNSHDGIR